MGGDDGRVRRRVVVSGRVQGVFFRDECRRRADDSGVAGWVANRPDGRVEACFEGDAQAVESMVAWCGEGTSQADVRDVEVAEEEPRGERGFSV